MKIQDYDNAGRKVFWVRMAGETTTYNYNRRPIHIIDTVEERSFMELHTRPYHKHEGIFYTLCDEQHAWITEQASRYVIDYRYLYSFAEAAWAIGLPTEEDAVAYTLRWL